MNDHILQSEVYLLCDYWMWLNPLLLTSVINGGDYKIKQSK
jgi:hypothetical protein